MCNAVSCNGASEPRRSAGFEIKFLRILCAHRSPSCFRASADPIDLPTLFRDPEIEKGDLLELG